MWRFCGFGIQFADIVTAGGDELDDDDDDSGGGVMVMIFEMTLT